LYEGVFLCLKVADIIRLEYDAPMKYGLLLLLLVASVTQAQVYRTVDKDGNVIYTDVPSDNAEEVVIDIAPSYTPPEITPLVIEEPLPETGESVDTPLYKLSITSPAQNQSFQNPETITVTVGINPELSELRSDKLLFKLDGKPIGEPQVSSSITLAELERGSHILVVSAVDKSGKVLKRSKSVLFHVHRRSVAQ